MPGLDAIEDRVLLSTVMKLLDDGTPGTLRYEIAHASSGETIDFALGLSGTIALDGGELPIDKSLEIRGPGAQRLTISGQFASRVFAIAPGDVSVVLAGLTITGGEALREGGGIHSGSGATLTVDDCILVGNRVRGGPGEAGKGAAIFSDAGATLTVSRCRIIGNEALGGGPGADQSGGPGEGGGLFLVTGSVTDVTDSLFTRNRAIGGPGFFGGHSGGAAINNHGQLTVTRSLITDNVSIGGAGALGGFTTSGGIINENSPFSSGAERGATLTLDSSTIAGNRAIGGFGTLVGGSAFGAGILNLDADLTVRRSRIIDNAALPGVGPVSGFSLGGGILSFGGTVCFTDTIIRENQASIHLFDDVLILSETRC